MDFTATYRDRTGAMREERVEAASRSEAVAALKARGIVPMRVEAISGAKAQRRRPQNGESAVSRRSVVYVLAVVFDLLSSGGLWWWLARPAETITLLPEKPKTAAMPKEVKSVQRTRVHKPGKVTHKAPPPQTPEERLAWFKEKYGDNIPENLKTTVYFLEHPPTQTYRPLPQPEDVFKHQSEKTIAAVLLMKPGTFVMRRTVYDESFDADFKKAMEEPTEIEDDDSEETKELKAAVNEVKAEWAEKMRSGEKPSAIMTQVMDTAYELGKYTREIETLLHEVVADPANTDKDIEDFVGAANQMLKEKGAEELPMPNLIRRQIRTRLRTRRAQKRSGTNDK